MRGFKSLKKQNDSISQRSMKQTDYEHLEKLYKHDNARTINARVWFRRPPYYINRSNQWEKKTEEDTTE